MLENLLKFSHKFKMIINFDSAAIYDRSTDILNRKENELITMIIMDFLNMLFIKDHYNLIIFIILEFLIYTM